MSHPPTRNPHTRNPKLAASLALALFASAALAYIISGHASGAGNNDTALRAVFDQERFHLEAIIRFSAQWPFLDFSDYESATTPQRRVPSLLMIVIALSLIGGILLYFALSR